MTTALLTGAHAIDHARMKHWNELTRDEQHGAVRAMADAGQSEITIASATGWSREYVRRVLGQRTMCKLLSGT